MKYDLEETTEVVRVLNLVEERKRKGWVYNMMASTVAQKLGTAISSGDNGGHTYQYQEEGLIVWERECFDRDSDYIGSVIDIRTSKDRRVFRSENEITTYIPGEWEQRLRDLYEPLKPKPQPLEKKIEVPSMTRRELQNLKSSFGIE